MAPLAAPTHKVGYAFSHALCAAADRLPSNLGRSTFVHSLVAAYGLVQRMQLIPPRPSRADLLTAHTDEYVNFLLALDRPDAPPPSEADLARFGLEHDCPVFAGVAAYAALVVGATLAAAWALAAGTLDIAVCWDGGRHHAFRDRAAGFCYVNDIVAGIFALQQRFARVLYLDVDIHHGDGVQAAFRFSPRVYTCSFHLHEPGVFSGDGREQQHLGRCRDG